MLISATFLVLAAPAHACEVEDPTGATSTCVDQYEMGWGDPTCEEQGVHTEGTIVQTGAEDVVTVLVRSERSCGHLWYEYTSESTRVRVTVNDYAEAHAGVSEYEENSGLAWCDIYLTVETFATGYTSAGRDCPW